MLEYYEHSGSLQILYQPAVTKQVLHRSIVCLAVRACVCMRAWLPSSAPTHPRRSDLGVVKGVLPIEDLGVASALSPALPWSPEACLPSAAAVATWGT